MKEKTFIFDQHAENQDWLKRLDFYKEELLIVNERLGELTRKNNDSNFLKEVEHFQNQFVIQRNSIDELGHNIRSNENQLIQEINQNPVAVDHRKVETHEAEAEFMGYFEKNFANLRAEFNQFASKWM
jgi:hypothetical protein